MVDYWAAMNSTDSRIGAEEGIVYMVLVKHANGDGTCYPAYPRLCALSHLSQNAVIKALRVLEDVGLIQRTPGNEKNPRGKTYRLPVSEVPRGATSGEAEQPPQVPRREVSRREVSPQVTSRYHDVQPPGTTTCNQTTPSTTPETTPSSSCALPAAAAPHAPTEHVLDLGIMTSTTTKPPRAPKAPRIPAGDTETPDFVTFYNAYPRHEARPKAARAWNTAAQEKGFPPLADMLKAVERYTQQVTREGLSFAYPATWLNQKRWTDEPTIPTNGQTSAHFRGSKEEYPAPRIDLGVPKEYLNA